MADIKPVYSALIELSSREFLGCPAPRSPDNGLSFIFNEGRIVRYRCHPGYKLRGHPHAVCTNSHWNRPAPLCLAKNGTRRDTAHAGHDKTKPEHNTASRQPFDWSPLYGSEDAKLPLINGQWRRPHHRGSRVFSLGPRSSSEEDTPQKSMLEQQLIEEEVKIAEMRHDQEQHVLSSRNQAKDITEGGVDDATADVAGDEDEEFNDAQSKEDDDIPTSTESPVVHTSSWLKQSGPREVLRSPSDISDYWKSNSGGYSSERHDPLDSENRKFGRGDTPARPIRDDRKPYGDEKPTVRFDDRGDTPARPIKGDRDPYDSAGRSLSTSSPVDFYGRPVQVLTGEKAHQQEELLRRQYERAQRRKAFEQDILEEEARGRPEEKAPIRFDPPPRGDNEPITSRPFDYFGRPVQVHTGEKAAQAEALLREQYERVQSRMRENTRLQEARRPPEEQTFHRQPQLPQRGDIPLRERGDREEVTRESPRQLVTSRPYDYFGRPVQVLTGEKAAQAEEMLRRQYEQYQQQLNSRRDRNQEEAVGRPVEFERRPVQPSSGEVTSSPFDHFGRPVQVLSGEKAGQQTELLRRMYERAESSRNIQESRRRPVEEVHRSPREHRHRHNHGQEQATDYESSRESRGPAAEGTSGSLRLSKEDMELMSKLTPDVRESYLKDLRKARMKEETDPVRANEFLSRYQNTWKSRASQYTKSLDKEPANDASNEDNVDDKDDYDDELQNDQPEEDIPVTTASTEDTSSESSEDNSTRDATATFTSSKASYDQTCLRDRKQGTSFLSAPKVKHAYVYKYERKVLTKPPYSHYVLARYKCLFGYRFKYEKADALYCKQREWIGEHPHCVREES
ncbi:conserved hypothetical protein [Ixodes scapularis]|uniref:Sushi domain-containing protein n=1 Tax=Ixodes scapularis TaxID=6945 RepID=B7Q411_IXOSC|nr:conserved hypothetical protein [Ixodes scapularis]|eukprot:XP_002411441.1 conserved hypothetical protein [Ixodes scapularis]